MKLLNVESLFRVLVIFSFAIFGSPDVNAESPYFFRSINSADGLPDFYIRDIMSDKEGYIYFSTDKGIYRYDGNRITGVSDSFLKSRPSLFPSNPPYSTSHESNKSTFVAADGNVWIYDSFGYGLESHDSGKKFFSKYIIKDIDEDLNGNLWIATNNSGVIVFNTKTEEYVELQHDSSKSHSLPTNHTTCVFIDSISSTVWIGTSNNGVAVTSLLKEGLDEHKTGVAHDVSGFSVNQDGMLLIGYDGGGLFYATGERINIPAEVVTNLLYNSTKRITYVATYGDGIYVLEDKGVKPLPGCDKHSPAAFSRQMAVDSKGCLWIGTFSNGLLRRSDKGEIRQYRSKDAPLGSDCIVGIDRHDDTLFVASTAGICTVDLKTMTFKKLSLPDKITIRAIRLDSNGQLWIATDRCIFTPGFQKIPIANIRALTFDKDDNCWISSADGISVIQRPAGMKNGYSYFFFPARITGNSNGFNKYSIYTMPDGKILAGSFGGYLEISPSDILKLCKSSLKVSSIRINDRIIPFSDKITLNYNDTLNIDLGSINYLIPKSGHFGYRILPDTVIHPIENAHISLSELPAGKSRLQLMELNSGDTTEIELKVKRPLSFYLYIIATVIICLTTGGLLLRRYFRKLRRPATEGMPPADRQFMDRLEGILERELGNMEFSVESFAAEMGMSRSNLYKKISHLTGKSPLEFLRDKRVEKGKQLLDEGHSHIGQVAYSVGLSPKQFSKFFKEKYDTLPSEYIRPVK